MWSWGRLRGYNKVSVAVELNDEKALRWWVLRERKRDVRGGQPGYFLRLSLSEYSRGILMFCVRCEASWTFTAEQGRGWSSTLPSMCCDHNMDESTKSMTGSVYSGFKKTSKRNNQPPGKVNKSI